MSAVRFLVFVLAVATGVALAPHLGGLLAGAIWIALAIGILWGVGWAVARVVELGPRGTIRAVGRFYRANPYWIYLTVFWILGLILVVWEGGW